MKSYLKIGRRKTQRKEQMMRKQTEGGGGEGGEREDMREKIGERSQWVVKAM